MFKSQYSDIRIFLGCMWEAVLWQAYHNRDLGLIQGHSICGEKVVLGKGFLQVFGFPLSLSLHQHSILIFIVVPSIFLSHLISIPTNAHIKISYIKTFKIAPTCFDFKCFNVKNLYVCTLVGLLIK